MLTSYHTHTSWSDGTASLAAMIAGARRAGLDELGISDHYVLCPGGKEVDWSMPLSFLDEYVANVHITIAETQSPAILLGLETDYFPETIDELAPRLAQIPFDYVIGSVHFVDGFPIDGAASYWEAISQDERNAMWRAYWQRMRAMAETGIFDIAGHLDLPKKFGFLPTVDLTAEEDAVLDAIAAAGMSMEINTGGWQKPVGEAYPSLRLLREARRRDIPLIINADAHRPEDLAYRFADARELARQAGYTELVHYRQRECSTYPL